jgi:hypothetical protein
MKRSPPEVVQAQLDAYNRKDIDELVGTYAHDAEQFTLHGNRIAKGREEMRARFLARFAEPDLHAQMVTRVVVGNFVTDLEIIMWNFPEGPGTLEMLCIYEVVDGLIQRASFAIGKKTLRSENSD